MAFGRCKVERSVEYSYAMSCDAQRFGERRLFSLVSILLSIACGGPARQELFGPNGGSPGGDAAAGGATPDGGTPGSSGRNAGAGLGGSSAIGGGGAGGVARGGSNSGSGGKASEQGGQVGTGGSSTKGGQGTGAQSSAGEGSNEGAGGATAGSGGSAGCVPTSAEVCDGLDNDCDDEIDGGNTCPFGCTGQKFEHRVYMFCGTERSFASANRTCALLGMRLLWIESELENETITAAMQNLGVSPERAWIGASDTTLEGSWYWVDAERMPHTAFWSGGPAEGGGSKEPGSYANWGVGRPNDGQNPGPEDCATLSIDRTAQAAGTWNDDACSDPWPFICEEP